MKAVHIYYNESANKKKNLLNKSN